MAEKKEDLDLDAQKPKGKKHLVLYAVIGLLVIGLGATTVLLLLRGGEKEGAPKEAVEHKKAIYVPLESLVVNFSAKGPARFLQVDIQVMTYDSKVVEAMETHMPVIRNDLLLLLSSQEYATISTYEGKEKLRADIQAAIQKILQQQGDASAIEAVYFTNFVMQ